MALRLELKQGQALVMTPQLQQSIKLLQLSHLELASFIERELAENPLLQRAEEASRRSDGTNAPDKTSASDNAPTGLAFPRNSASHELPPNDFAPPERPTLRAHLEEQLNLAATCPKQRLIGLNLIDMVDETGYLRGDLARLAERLGTTPNEIECVLSLLQSFDPAGVAARDLAECLGLQLRELGRYDPMIARLLNHLDLIAAQDFSRLARVCEAEIEDVRDMIAEIRKLDPKPGLRFGGEPVSQITPDVTVSALGDGSWRVELNGETLPRLLIDRTYLATVRAHAGRDERAFLGECLNAANWLVKSLDQRAKTILKVAEEIVRRQDGFLRYGAEHLHPMTLRDVASKIDMHESTVSRASAHKYMATPRGLFEFRYFFTSAVPGAEGTVEHSSEAVRYRIKHLIDAESPDAVLSDDQIVAVLRETGINVARRTVAKYRDIMRIPASAARKRAKRLELLEKVGTSG